jgi:predicted nucleic acid-binding protein
VQDILYSESCNNGLSLDSDLDIVNPSTKKVK